MAFMTGCRGSIHHESWLPEGEVRSTVLLLHGYAEHLGLYSALATRLTQDSHAVHALDEVGHGRSDGDRAVIESWDIVVEDAHRLATRIVAEHPGVPLTVIGHSGGALAAYLLVTRYPGIAQALVLSAGPLQPLDWMDAELSGAVEEPGDLDPTSMLSTHPEYVHALLHDPLVYKDGFRRETLEAVTQTWPEVAGALAAGRPDLPTLMVHGEEDPVVPLGVSQAVAARLPRVELHTFPGDLHDVLNEHDREQVHEVIATWMARTLDTQPASRSVA